MDFNKDPSFETMLTFAQSQLRNTVEELHGRAASHGGGISQLPHFTQQPHSEGTGSSVRKIWTLVAPDHWVSGFYPGLLWRMYEHTHDEFWKSEADKYTALLRHNTKHHDLGMQMYYSFGLAYSISKNEPYLDAAVEACGHLAKKFQPKVGAINAWGRSLVIIDTLINIQLFLFCHQFRADQGDGHRTDPQFNATDDASYYAMAVRHADVTMKELVKADGSTFHVFTYDHTGKAIRWETTPQGYGLSKSRTSVWARGQAWAIYGYAALYRFTHFQRYLETAMRATDWYLDHIPKDMVPYWDFGVPPPLQKRDTSTAACAAAGMIELAQLLLKHAPSFQTKALRYLDAAKATLKALYQGYRCSPSQSNAILEDAVSVFPAQHSIIYGDYFFVEALLRLQNFPPTSHLDVAKTTQPRPIRSNVLSPSKSIQQDLPALATEAPQKTSAQNELPSHNEEVKGESEPHEKAGIPEVDEGSTLILSETETVWTPARMFVSVFLGTCIIVCGLFLCTRSR